MKSQEGSKPAERLNGSEILVRALAEEGVEYVFGYPGGSVLNIFDAIYKQDNFKHIIADKAYMEKCFTEGAQKAACTANKTLAKVQRKMGLASKKL